MNVKYPVYKCYDNTKQINSYTKTKIDNCREQTLVKLSPCLNDYNQINVPPNHKFVDDDQSKLIACFMFLS